MDNKRYGGYTSAALTCVGIAIALFVLLGTFWVVGYGWVTNLKELVKLLGQQEYSTGMAILRGFGVLLAPLGAILGYVV